MQITELYRSSPVPERLNLSAARVLVVDDSSAFTDVIVQVLLGFGISQITCAASADEAQEKCAAAGFDLVLCDGQMPGMDGYAFVRWLRCEHGGENKAVPVIMLSAHASLQRVVDARDSGANFIVAKPVQPAVLLERIRWIANDSRAFIDCEAYVGPDRRFKLRFPNPGRRREDAASVDPELVGVELSQDGVDALFD